MKMKRTLLALTFVLLTLSASAQSDSIKVERRAAYRGDVAVSAFAFPFVGLTYAIETTHGVALGRRGNVFVGGGFKYLYYDSPDIIDDNPNLHYYTGYVRGKYIVPSKKMKVNFFVSGDVGVGFWKSYNLETQTSSQNKGLYLNGDVGMAIKLYKQLSLDLSVGMWGALGDFGSPHLKLGFTF